MLLVDFSQRRNSNPLLPRFPPMDSDDMTAATTVLVAKNVKTDVFFSDC